MIIHNGETFIIRAVLLKDIGRVIGNNGRLAYSIKEDMQHFRKVTDGFTLLMGYKSAKELYEMTPHGLGPNRKVAVLLTRPLEITEPWHEQVEFVDSIYDIIHDDLVMVAGGASVYDKYADIIDVWHVTQVHERHEYIYTDPSYYNPTMISPETLEAIERCELLVIRADCYIDRISGRSVPVLFNCYSTIKHSDTLSQ